jgi:hypothetical protein
MAGLPGLPLRPLPSPVFQHPAIPSNYAGITPRNESAEGDRQLKLAKITRTFETLRAPFLSL